MITDKFYQPSSPSGCFNQHGRFIRQQGVKLPLTVARDADYIFISDLHLSSVFSSVNSMYGSHGMNHLPERGSLDDVFSRFMAHFQNLALRQNRHLHLVLLGDAFDFLRVENPSTDQVRYSLDTSENTMAEKIRQIASSHPAVFETLGRLVSAGFSLDVIPGNHDIELIWQPTQTIFKELVVKACQGNFNQHHLPQSHPITFYPWIYHVPGVLYAEHGQQYHFINSFASLLPLVYATETRRATTICKIEPPLGSHFEVYLSSLVKVAEPFLPNRSPSIANVFRTVLSHPALLLKTMGSHTRFAVAANRDLLHRLLSWQSAKQRSRIEAIFQRAASDMGLSATTLAALYQMSQVSLASMFRSVLHKAGMFHPAGSSSSEKPTYGYLYQAALAIHQLLKNENMSVPYYIFGHTHQTARVPLDSSGDAQSAPSCYLNTGSWIGQYTPPGSWTSPEPAALRFVRVSVRPGKPPIAEVLAWNDATGRPEPVFSFAS